MRIEPVRVVALDDYQDVTRDYEAWKCLDGRVEIVTLTEHIQDRDELVAALAGAQVVLAMRERTTFDRALLERLPDLRLLLTKGMWNAAIDVDAAAEHGIIVAGTQGTTTPTLELTWALILALIRNLVEEDRGIREGGWQRTIGGEVAGRTLAVVGLGKLGTKVAHVGQAFGMNVIAWSQNLSAEAAAEKGVRAVAKGELFETADVVSVHLKLSERTTGVIGAAELSAMKGSAFIVNTARGPIIDEQALLDALRDGTIAGAGLDVYGVEPLPLDHPFRSAPRTVLTPHVGYVTEESYQEHYDQVVEGIEAWLAGQPIRVIEPNKKA